MAKNGIIYVIGEPDAVGPVKIGMTFDEGGKVGRGGLNTGNWRELQLVGSVPVESEIVRWREWLTHRRLRHRHVRGEWFNVRDLAGDGWINFLDAVWNGTCPGLYDVDLGVDGHRIVTVRQPDAPSRHFVADCSCGRSLDGGLNRALPSAQRDYLTDHLGLATHHPLATEFRVQVHHKGFPLHAYPQLTHSARPKGRDHAGVC